MEKVFGATERHDSLIIHRSGKAVLIFGYGEENEQGYDFRHTFEHKPTKEEVLAVIVSHVNEQTDLKILTGYEWNGKKVWLSSENSSTSKLLMMWRSRQREQHSLSISNSVRMKMGCQYITRLRA